MIVLAGHSSLEEALSDTKKYILLLGNPYRDY